MIDIDWKNDTICAVSTPFGVGGIAVIRVSGRNAIEIANEIFCGRKPLLELPAQTAHYGVIKTDDGITLDDVILTIWRAPHSYTAENTIEISCHGSTYIQKELINLLLSHGCRLAKHGEFTRRAYLNGRMDLIEAEGVADVISAQSAVEHKIAMNQLRGQVSSDISLIRDELVQLISLVELGLDFSEEDVDFVERTQLADKVELIDKKVGHLISTFRAGNAVRNGIQVTIVGETNVGKSTIMNRLSKNERSIVSEIRGTTRDIVEDEIYLHGIRFRLQDTAGLRETEDKVERIGIERALSEMHKASIILWIVDARNVSVQSMESFASLYELNKQQDVIILILNKAEKLDDCRKLEVRDMIKTSLSVIPIEILFCSAQFDENLKSVESAIVQVCNWDSSIPMISNLRHFEALENAHKNLTKGIEMLRNAEISPEFVIQSIRGAVDAIGTITGEITNEEILSTIFSKFCIGK